MFTRNTRWANYLVVILLCGMAGSLQAAGPDFIQYRATLMDSNGDPVADGTYRINFAIYADELGGTSLWNEELYVDVKNGSFKEKLGLVHAFSEDLFADTLRWIGIAVEDDDEMEPRSLIGSVPWSLNSAFAEKVANKSVGKDEIKDKGVGRSQLDDKAVGKGQLDDKAVGKSQIDDKAVGKGQLEDLAVGVDQLDLLAVTRDKINNGAVGLQKLAQEGAVAGQIIKWSGTAWELADDEIDPEGGSHWYLSPANVLTTSQVNTTEGSPGLARYGAVLIGGAASTHVNLGNLTCTTGRAGSSAAYCVIGGGHENTAISNFSTIAGGEGNQIIDTNTTGPTESDWAFIGGGSSNTVWARSASIVGGVGNEAAGIGSTVGGGKDNHALGDNSTIPGGIGNDATGKNSLAAGSNAHAAHDGAVVICARDLEHDTVASSHEGQMVLHAEGRFFFSGPGTQPPIPAPNHFIGTATGAYLSINGTWESVSDKNAKENFEAIDPADVLDQLAALEVTRWNYKTESSDVKHIGPTAQDFHAQFGVGQDERTISSIDASGIALAAIKALHEKTTELEKTSQETEELKTRVDELTRLVEQLLQERSTGGRGR